MKSQKNSSRNIILIVILIIITSSLFNTSCKTKQNKDKIALPIESILDSYTLFNGDIALRKGNSIESETVSALDGFGDYSHIGIIYFLNNKPYVIHIVPDTLASTIDFCKIEPLAEFFSNKNVRRGCILRIHKSKKHYADSAAIKAFNYYTERVIFDESYDLLTNDKLYCTELVWKSFLIDSLNLIDEKSHMLKLPIFENEIILPSAFLKSSYLENIYYF